MMASRWVGFEAATPFCFPPGLEEENTVRSIEQVGVCRSLRQSQRFLGWSEVMMLDGATRRRNNSAMR